MTFSLSTWTSVFVYYVLTGWTCSSKPPELFCGFPGAPANGVANPEKSLYKVGENVVFKCDAGFKLDGPPSNFCNKQGEWQHPLPVCATNVAYKQPALQSSTYIGFNASLAVDGNVSTCSQTINSGKGPKKYWRVRLEKECLISSVRIQTRGNGNFFSVSIGIVDPRTNQLIESCNTISVSKRNFIDETAVCSYANKDVKGSVIQINDERNYGPLWLCEVEVTVMEPYPCGRPDIQPNCILKMKTLDKIDVAEYEAKAGFVLKGKKHRTCKEGKWDPPAPLCLNGRDGNEGGNVTTTAKTKESLGNDVVIGIAIGVAAASISTIFVIVLVVFIMRKYYKRCPSQPTTVASDHEGIFLHGNHPSSCSSGSPTIHTNYSDPWDDPKTHTYEYISPESFLANKTKETSFSNNPPSAPKVDGGNYLVSGRRNNSRDGDYTARESLIEAPVTLRMRDPAERRRLPEPLSSPYALPEDRVQSLNELEVDAYGYPEIDEHSRV